MSDSSGKWLPYNLDNSLHECSTSQNNLNKKTNELTLKLLNTRITTRSYGI